jgi:hypothetical protein
MSAFLEWFMAEQFAASNGHVITERTLIPNSFAGLTHSLTVLEGPVGLTSRSAAE